MQAPIRLPRNPSLALLAVLSLAAGAARGQSLFVSSSADDRVLEFDSNTGAYLGEVAASGSAGLDEPRELLIGPDGDLFVASLGSDAVLEYDLPQGTSLGSAVASGAGGLDGPWAIVQHSGAWYVTSASGTGCVLKYDVTSGAFLGTFACASSPPSVPQGLAVTASGHLAVAYTFAQKIVEYDLATGSIVQTITTTPVVPRGLAIGPNGHLFAAALMSDKVVEYDLATGALVGDFVTAGSGGLDGPQDLAFRPDGTLLVTSSVTGEVIEYDAAGAFSSVLVAAGSGGLSGPVGLALGTAVGSTPPALADYGDAPDDAPACGTSAGVPTDFPTLFDTTNAVAGRTGPFHVSKDTLADFTLRAGPTKEALPYQPVCDWITCTTGMGTCDFDDGPLVLCLSPTCNTGVLVVDAGGIYIAGAAFGPPPPVPVMGWWIFDVSMGPFADPATPRFANVVVDWDLSGKYGDTGLEWAMADGAIAYTPFASQTLITGTFPVLTVGPAPGTMLGWSIGPFWSRFHVSDESLVPVFPAGDWDGSGKATGYAWGDEEDWVVSGDPGTPTGTVVFPDCDANGIPDSVDIFLGYLHDADGNGIPDECGATQPYCVSKQNSLGCYPYAGAAGQPSLSQPQPFDVRANLVLNQKSGLCFYGYGPNNAPFQGGTLCVQPPLKRIGLQSSGGSQGQNDCSGSLVVDFNQQIQSGNDPGLVVGATVFAQFWSRDPAFNPPNNTSLTNAIRFSVAP